MKSISLVLVFAFILSVASFDDVKSKSLAVDQNIIKEIAEKNITALRIYRLENEINELFSKVKENLRKNYYSNMTTVDIIRKSIDANETGILQHYPESCSPYASAHGIYTVKLPKLEAFEIFCDTQIAGSGWTVIQRRTSGNLNFFRNWTQYKKGFGNISDEFFIGLDKLHAITSLRQHELYIQLEDFNGEKRYARYDEFLISNESNYYKLEKLGSYSGNAGDSLTNHKNMKFSTFDSDHDIDHNSNCAEGRIGAWWYKDCAVSNLNGLYLNGPISHVMSAKGVVWNDWKGSMYSYKSVQMMVRPKCPCAY